MTARTPFVAACLLTPLLAFGQTAPHGPAPATAPAAPQTAAPVAPPATAAAATAAPGTPAAPGAPAPAAAGKTAAGIVPLEPLGFDYEPEGRRDPFISLLRRGGDARGSADGARPAGLAGLEASEVVLKGTLHSRGGYVAILQGADTKTYIVRPGDRLFDGAITTISDNSLVILQHVNDPLSRETQREVRKTIRQMDEAK
jgi:Tfp pilus assembly protein PilP